MPDSNILVQARRAIEASQWDGLTYKELLDDASFEGEGHGSASAALTRLHADCVIARLTERRLRCSVYVMPQYLGGREHGPYRSYTGEAKADAEALGTPWALLGSVAACTCPCTCGARTNIDVAAAVQAAKVSAGQRKPLGARSGPPGDVAAPPPPSHRSVVVSDEERLRLEMGQ